MPPAKLTNGVLNGLHDEAPDENEANHEIQQQQDDTTYDYDFSPVPQWWDGQEEIVISGISGRMPDSDNLEEFWHNLYNHVDMITEDNRRWEPGYYGLPTRHGKIKEVRRFDAGFFGVHPKQASSMDPQLRLLLETSYEAIIDAGVNPQNLRGTTCGVFVASAAHETSGALTSNPDTVVGYSLTGCTHAMFSNRISYAFDLRGPSFTVDAACSGSLLAFQLAVDAIRQGQCDAALVGGTHLTLSPNTTLQFLRMSMLSMDGKCRSCDANANGYVRSECVGAVFLQKVSDARRIYASVVHAKSNTDGYKEQGITFPSKAQQIRLMMETYKEAGLDPRKVAYVETHGTGTKVGDPQECNAIATVFCNNRPDPLLIGSVKSNAGHSEPASGIMSLAKVILAMERDIIPANLHFEQPNPNIIGLIDGRMKVVSKNTPWKPSYIGISSFGFGGSNSHLILKPPNRKVDPVAFQESQIPLLLMYPGRTNQSVENALKTFEDNKRNVALFNMMCEQSAIPTNLCQYRGFTVTYPFGKRVPSTNGSGKPENDLGAFDIQKVQVTGRRPIYLVYSGMGSQWVGMGRELMCLELFKKVIERCSKAIDRFGVNIIKLIKEGTAKDFENNTMNCFVVICAIQIALTDLLRSFGIKEDGVIGHSAGEMACSYADGCTTVEQTMQIAYFRGKTLMDQNFPLGAMAVVGLSWNELPKRLTNGVHPACQNAPNAVTVSGEADKVSVFMQKMQNEGVFVKKVDSSGMAFHSPCMKAVVPTLREHLIKVIPNPKPRSPTWISSSIPKSDWESDLAKYSSADYHVNNVTSVVLFDDAMKCLPENAVVIEVAPHTLLQSVLKQGMPQGCKSFGLMSANHPNNVEYLLQNLGKIYQAGVDVNVKELYPKAREPAPKGTPMLAGLVDWDHSQVWDTYMGPTKMSKCECNFTVDPFASGSEDKYILDHIVDGRVLYPFTGYLVLAWKGICKLRGLDWMKTPVIMEKIKCIRATLMTAPVKFDVCITPTDGYFEIWNNDAITCSGYIRLNNDEDESTPFVYENIHKYPEEPADDGIRLTNADIYKEFQLRGYEYGPAFRCIHEAKNTGTEATLSWSNNYVTFIDSLLQTNLIQEKGDTLRVPVRMRYLRIDPIKHAAAIEQEGEKQFVRIRNHLQSRGVIGGGVEASDLIAQTMPKRSGHTQKVTLERVYFSPYIDRRCFDDFEALRDEMLEYNQVCRALAVEAARQALKASSAIKLTEACRYQLEKVVSESKVKDVDQKSLSAWLAKPKCVLARLLSKAAASCGSKTDQAQMNGHAFTNGEQHKLEKESVSELKSDRSALQRKFLLDLESDKLWNLFWHDRPLRNLFDVVCENTAGHLIKIACIEPISTTVMSLLRMHLLTHPLSEGEFSLIGPHVEELDEEKRAADNMQIYVYDLNSKQTPSNAFVNQDVVVLDRALHRQADPVAYLSLVGQFLRDDGFLIVNEITNNFETALVASTLCSSVPLVEPLSNGFRKLGVFLEEERLLDAFERSGFRLVGVKSHGDLPNTVYLLHKIPPTSRRPVVVDVDDVRTFDWLPKLQSEIEQRLNAGQEETVWLVSNQVRDNGAVGLSLCLREENSKNRIRYIADVSHKTRSGPPVITLENSDVQEMMTNDLISNLYRDGTWGSMKHLLIKEDEQLVYEEVEHADVNFLVKGDLSSLSWIESRNQYFDFLNSTSAEQLCAVYYASLNFRDIMLTTGRLAADAIFTENLDKGASLMGMEYVGRLKDGKRVMGALNATAMATSVVADLRYAWDVPESWSMEQAATVPIAYMTAIYALIVRGRMRRGESVLIHSASGGVGQAAVAVALAYNCRVFVTVGNQEKREFLRKRFPQLNEKHFFSSRSTEFELQLMQATEGKGVDIVLNSLSEDKLQASLRCLRQHGRFLEIGKFDLANNSELGMYIFLKNISIHGIIVDSLAEQEDWFVAHQILQDGIDQGFVQPLPVTVFDCYQLEDAFRFMAQGIHTGKIVLKIRDEEPEKVCAPKKIKVRAIRRTLCHPQHVFIVAGGLGGFGLELVHWLFTRGGKKFVLTSRSGVRTGYQKRCINFWQKHGAQVLVSKLDVADHDQTVELIKEAQKMGPIAGIFNLAMVLRDCLFEDQTIQNFKEAALPKYYGTQNLDKVSRDMCDKCLKWFVVFSSISCGRGNAGQTNYGWANSTMERIVEQRRFDGLPAMGIQWGAVGDVGIILEHLGDNSTIVGGSWPQRMASCLQALDLFLCLDHPLVSSFVRSETQSKSGQGETDILKAVAKILGVNDASQLDANAHLADLGLDSLMGVEIKQTLERDYDLVLSMKDIRALTLSKLKDMFAGGPISADANKSSTPLEDALDSDELEAMRQALVGGFRMRIDLDNLKPNNPCIRLNEVSQGLPVFFLHPIEGSASALIPLARAFQYPAYGFQCTPEAPTDSTENLALFYIQEMRRIQKNGPYRIVGYSYGACIAFEMAVHLQRINDPSASLGSLILIDGSYKYNTLYRTAYRKFYNVASENLINNPLFESEILCGVLSRFVPMNYRALRSEMLALPSIKERLEKSVQLLLATGQFKDKETTEYALEAFWKKMIMSDHYQPLAKLHGDLTLIKAKIGAANEGDLGDDYGLGEIVNGKVHVHIAEGDHYSMIHDENASKLASILTQYLQDIKKSCHENGF